MDQRPLTFDLQQLAMVSASLRRSEALVARWFRIPALPSKQYPYEVVTLADLDKGERAPEALAHLVVYERSRPSGPEHLYRICLQDDQIIGQASGEPGDEAWLRSLLVYVLTHELVHVVRFQRAEQSFMAGQDDRRKEEDQVHSITIELLEQAREPNWERVKRLYGNPVIPIQLVQDG